jgi:Asp-tRNA(Asn)/Glu-tRNA(Gln) amidotransferase C subunit
MSRRLHISNGKANQSNQLTHIIKLTEIAKELNTTPVLEKYRNTKEIGCNI